jgi:SAM-dependent methyltransferase
MDYQHDFAASHQDMYDREGRRRKAATALAVMADFAGAGRLQHLHLLNVGSSTGLMDGVFAEAFGQVDGIDIDAAAVAYASEHVRRPNLRFRQGDAMAIPFPDASVDAVVCSQVYEHVPDQDRLMGEIERVLRPGGFCYFACTNRYIVIEPHYRLPLLSWLPPALADRYLRWTRGEPRYYERMRSLRNLRKLVARFECIDYTQAVLADPATYGFDYLVPPGSFRQRLYRLVARRAPAAFPGYLWVLRKRG